MSTSAFFGPWTSPPACNSSAQCDEFLTAISGGVQGLGRSLCFSGMAPVGPVVSTGGCACDGSFALGGSTCGEQTMASPATKACVFISAFVALLIVVRFSRVLFGLFRHRGILKMNAAGTSYGFAWIALLASLITYLANIPKTFVFFPGAFTTTDITGRVQIIFLAIAVLNLVAAFIEMSSSIKLIQNIDKLRIPVIIAITAVCSLIVFTFLFADAIVSAIIAFIVVLLLAILGIVGPVVIYVRATRRMGSSMGMFVGISNWQMFKAILGEIFLGNQQMRRVLGITHTDSDSKGADGESRNSREDSVLPDSSTKRQSKERQSGKKKSLPNTPVAGNRHLHRGEIKTVKFLSRAVRMGFWLSLSLTVFLAATGFAIQNGTKVDTKAETYRVARITGLVQEIFIVSALYQILWFLSDGYSKTLSARTRIRKTFRSESKDLAVSKDDTKVDCVANETVHSTGKEAVVPHNL